MSAAPPLVAASILDAIGGTPLVRLRFSGGAKGVELFAKCEWLNPGGSVKDRTALSLVREGERHGTLRRARTIIDSSSGNTAVGLALVGQALGYAVELVMPASVSPERRRLCEAYGAQLTLTSAFDGSDGALERVREIVAASPGRYFYADQYRNPANPLAHYRTTGPELWRQTSGRISHFVAGLGTSGTVMGAGRYLRERNATVRIVAVEPDHALHGIEGLKHMQSAIVPEIYSSLGHDRRVRVATEDARAACREVLASDGLFVGHSSGAVLLAARQVAREIDHGVVVALLADGGERYLAGAAQ